MSFLGRKETDRLMKITGPKHATIPLKYMKASFYIHILRTGLPGNCVDGRGCWVHRRRSFIASECILRYHSLARGYGVNVRVYAYVSTMHMHMGIPTRVSFGTGCRWKSFKNHAYASCMIHYVKDQAGNFWLQTTKLLAHCCASS